jgi:hypothetical protein
MNLMKPQVTIWMSTLAMAAGFIGSHSARADALQISEVEPAHVWRETETLEIAIIGRGFDARAAIRFLLAGTDSLGGIAVERVKILSSKELVATVVMEPGVTPGYFDVEISGNKGETVRGNSLLLVEPYSWAARFGCTGAESSRRRIPCRRGAIG